MTLRLRAETHSPPSTPTDILIVTGGRLFAFLPACRLTGRLQAMASLANSDDEDLALVLRLSQLSSNDFDEQIAQLPPEGSASVEHISRWHAPTSDEKDDLALALRLSLLSSDEFDENVARLHPMGPASLTKDVRPLIPPSERDEDDLELAPSSSELPAVRELPQQRQSPMAIGGSVASLLTAISLVQVRAAHFYTLTTIEACDRTIRGALSVARPLQA